MQHAILSRALFSIPGSGGYQGGSHGIEKLFPFLLIILLGDQPFVPKRPQLLKLDFNVGSSRGHEKVTGDAEPVVVVPDVGGVPVAVGGAKAPR